MAKINLGADDERVIIAALEGYARHLDIKHQKMLAKAPGISFTEAEKLAKDSARATRLAGIMKDWRRSIGEPAPEIESDVEPDDEEPPESVHFVGPPPYWDA